VSADWTSILFAFASPSMIPTYKLIDELMMKFLQPTVWFAFYSWASPLVCAQLIPLIFTTVGKTNPLTNADSIAVCNKGVEVWWKNFYVGGT